MEVPKEDTFYLVGQFLGVPPVAEGGHVLPFKPIGLLSRRPDCGGGIRLPLSVDLFLVAVREFVFACKPIGILAVFWLQKVGPASLVKSIYSLAGLSVAEGGLVLVCKAIAGRLAESGEVVSSTFRVAGSRPAFCIR